MVKNITCNQAREKFFNDLEKEILKEEVSVLKEHLAAKDARLNSVLKQLYNERLTIIHCSNGEMETYMGTADKEVEREIAAKNALPEEILVLSEKLSANNARLKELKNDIVVSCLGLMERAYSKEKP